MYLLGYDVGSSSVKAALLELDTGECIASAFYPKTEMAMLAKQTGWAEQEPGKWWESIKAVTKEILTGGIDKNQIKAIGISYQMHGLVVVDKDQKVLRPSIIWCDSRAVEIGDTAFQNIGADQCLSCMLNSPGNFTASKLKWVKDNEPELYEHIHNIMLPGDYIAMKLSGEINTTLSGLSEGILWDFKNNSLSANVMQEYGFDESLIPNIVHTFAVQSQVSAYAAQELGLAEGTPISYRAGDQPNNALSLNVLQAGEIAATAGTSGVVYGVSDQIKYDPQSRVNTFAHVNHLADFSPADGKPTGRGAPKLGVLLCINGTGILNAWVKRNTGDLSYEAMNELAAKIPVGSEGLSILPFGNGAERVLNNKEIGCQIAGLNFNTHGKGHLIRAAQEGIVFSLKYGFDIMQETGIEPNVIRAGFANMFLSPIFSSTLANLTNTSIELYNTDGAQGAARGAGIGAGLYNYNNAFTGLKVIQTIEPDLSKKSALDEAYAKWNEVLEFYV